MPKKKSTKRKPTLKPKKQKNIFMRFIAFITGLITVLAITLFIVTPNSQTSKIASVNDLGTFSGVLPCADCPGIETTISFRLSDDNKSNHTYMETLLYQGKNLTNTITGNWEYTVNSKRPNDVIIKLTPNSKISDSKVGVRYFQVINDNTLQMLDNDMNPIPLSNTILTKN